VLPFAFGPKNLGESSVSFRTRAVFGALLAVSAAAVVAQDMKLAYPQTAKGGVIDTQFGEAVADPYRWLENDVRTDPAVAQWVGQQNGVTQSYLATLPSVVGSRSGSAR
jgi:prolyl oligopeptidase